MRCGAAVSRGGTSPSSRWASDSQRVSVSLCWAQVLERSNALCWPQTLEFEVEAHQAVFGGVGACLPCREGESKMGSSAVEKLESVGEMSATRRGGRSAISGVDGWRGEAVASVSVSVWVSRLLSGVEGNIGIQLCAASRCISDRWVS